MSSVTRRQSLAALAATALPRIAWAQPTPLASLLRQRVARDGVGFAAVQVQPGGLRFTNAGVLRRGAAAPVTENTLFELGSITKVFVAVLLADAVLRQRVRLDDPVEAGLPDGVTLRDGRGEPLRLIDLATHRSGLPRMPDNLRPAELPDPYAGYTEARLLAFLRGWKQVVQRDARFEYSNLGYGLLAWVLSRLEGLPFDELLAARVLRPLGLSGMRLLRPLPSGDDLSLVAAAIGAELASAPNQAAGHGAERQAVPLWRFDVLAGAGGLLGSSASLGRFMQAALGLFEHPLQAAFAMCLQRHGDGEDPLHAVGLAWEIRPLHKHLLFNQDGATAGSSCSMWLDPARRSGAALLGNAFVETQSAALYALDAQLTQADFRLLP